MAFIRACALAELKDGTATSVDVDGLDVAFVKVDGDVYAIEDECSHAAVALSEGDVEGMTLECWMHGSRFDLRTGEPLGPPAIKSVPVFPVRVEGDDVLVDLTSTNLGDH